MDWTHVCTWNNAVLVVYDLVVIQQWLDNGKRGSAVGPAFESDTDPRCNPGCQMAAHRAKPADEGPDCRI